MKIRYKILFIVIMIGGILGFWASVFEPASFKISEESIIVSSWPAACNGKRIAVIADLHVGSPYKGLESLRDLVTKVNSKKPDLVLLPGDFVIQGVLGGTFVAPEEAAPILAKLHAPMGVFAVLGNHDWWLSASRVKNALKQNNIEVLEDASQEVSFGECRLRLVGISDFLEGPHNIKRAMSNIGEEEDVLAFTHNPDIFPELPQRIALTIAGHTHGGQVFLPIMGRLIVPSAYGERYAIGHIVENEKHLYVSSGVGTSIIPVRFLVPPEVTIIKVNKTQ